MAEVLAILLITAALTAATKSGRHLVKSAHKATGWRTPRSAMQHHSGRLGALIGRGVAASARTGRRAGTHAALASGRTARRAGQHAASTAGRRWQARAGTDAARAPLWRIRPAAPAVGVSGEPTAGTADSGSVPGVSGSPIGTDHAASGSSSSTTTTTTTTAGGTRTPAAAATSGDTSPPEPGSSGTGTSLAPADTTATVPTGTERRSNRMTTRYAINLEPPATDGEFLESCVQLGDLLKSLADQIGDWADGLGALNLPQSVLNPLHQVSEGITDAADGAAKAATAFEDEFEDARDVAARGMHFTGQDAA
jgi:hypothetical protein